jgi:lipid II:glycine glycyltransferase (peptidoglycan interpeptide bridge formation enzyme)
MALYWEAIRLACENGYHHFDFGRSSPDSGTYRFKAQWGAKPLPLFWYYGKNGYVPDINPKSAKFSLLVACWRRLPLALANSIGPIVSRSLP